MKIYLKTAYKNIRRSPFQSLAAIFVLFVTFFVTSLLLIFVYSSDKFIKYYETRPQVIAFLKKTASDEDIARLKAKLENDSRIKTVSYVTKEQAMEIYKKATKDNPLLSELVSPSYFPASLEFTLNDLSHTESLISEVKGEEIVDEVGFTASLGGEESLTDVVSRLRKISYYIRLIGGIFVGFLMGTSFILIVVIVSMRLAFRKSEMEILDLIGATSSFIKAPVLLEAFFYAFGGVIFGWLACLLVILYLTPLVVKYFGDIPILPETPLKLLEIFGVILLLELFMGLLLSFFGGIIAVGRTRKRIKIHA